MSDSRETHPERIAPETAATLIRQQSAVIFDVREPHEFEKEHIPDALSLPLSALDPTRLPNDKTAIVYCGTSKRSCAAATKLQQAGFTSVAVLEGGISGWKAAGLSTESTNGSLPMRGLRCWSVLVYGLIAYVVFLISFLYAIGFVGGFFVSKTIDSGAVGANGTSVLVNLTLLSLFAVQHSVMARPSFKRWWTQIIPPAIERSTYVLASSVILLLVFWLWQPLPAVVWDIKVPWAAGAIWATFGIGWIIVLVSTLLINHFDLFGLRQVFLYFTGYAYTTVPFQTPLLYRAVRHPIMLGFLIAFWATPMMTYGHLLFATVVTVYVLIALRLEERDLLAYHGQTYSIYQQQVRMLFPLPRSRVETRQSE